MKLDPSRTPEQIASLLMGQAGAVYGQKRAVEIQSQIEHLAQMLSEVASRECGMTELPPFPLNERARGGR